MPALLRCLLTAPDNKHRVSHRDCSLRRRLNRNHAAYSPWVYLLNVGLLLKILCVGVDIEPDIEHVAMLQHRALN